MTLDQTIKEAKVTAVLFENEACKYARCGGSFCKEQAKAFRESAREFEQVAEWLKELKAYREAHGMADRPQGEWIRDRYWSRGTGMGEEYGFFYKCSLCEYEVEDGYTSCGFNFCPIDEYEGCKECNFSEKPSKKTCEGCKSGDYWNYYKWSEEGAE